MPLKADAAVITMTDESPTAMRAWSWLPDQPSLLDLLARTGLPGHAPTPGERATMPLVSQALPSIGAAAGAIAFDGIAPLAAWLLLQSRWLGDRQLTVIVRDDDERLLRVTYDGGSNWRQWIDRVDAALAVASRTSPPAPGADSTCGAAQLVLIAPARAALASSTDAPDGSAPGWQLEYPCDRIGAALVAQCQAAVARVLRDVASRGEATPIGALSSVDGALSDGAQRLGCGPRVKVGADENLVSAFDAQAAATPDATALSDTRGELDYRSLAALSQAGAKALAAQGIGAGDIVAIDFSAAPLRDRAAIVAMLAILRAGAAYLPIDPRVGEVRIASMLTNAAARGVLRDGQGWLLAPVGAPTDAAQKAVVASRSIDFDADASRTASRRPAYLMYSSGSTGEPKGILIPHRAVIRLVRDAGFMALGVGERILHAAPLGFDASTLEIWGPLLNGGCCVVHDEAVATPGGLRRTLSAQRVTGAWLTAALFNQVVDDDPQALAPLRQLVSGGEALSVSHVRRALQALPSLTLINGYGPTENTTFTTTQRIDRARFALPPAGDVDPTRNTATLSEPAELPRSVPIGRPVNQTVCLVCGPDRRPLPVGMIGELYVAGDGLAITYLGQPALNASAFFDAAAMPELPSFEGHDVSRWYRTGDLVRWLPDGSLDYVGRVDSQIKIRGFRVELDAIEACLLRQPGIDAAAVMAYRHPVRGTVLCAYLVGAAATAVAPLRAALVAELPDYMVPAQYLTLPRLPVTANGKLDRAALPLPGEQRPALAVPYQAPQGELEQAIAAVFAAVLAIDRVGRDDNFFDLGGESLLVARALDRLHGDPCVRELGAGRHGEPASPVRLGVADFYGDATPRALARALTAAPQRDSPPTPSPMPTMPTAVQAMSTSATGADNRDEPIAIIGMAGRLPGADSIEAFWTNLCEGRDTIRHFTAAELDPSVPADLRADPAYVAARGVIDDADLFDAAFFGISAREAASMDPQQRLFLEICWQCLERAGERPQGRIGVFAGMHNATYLQRHLSAHPQAVERLGEFAVMLANEKDYLALRVANRLNLRGPAISLNTACSTSLVAIAQAVDSLRNGHCEMALAGGVAINCPPNSGYLYQEGSMLSPDGRTRTFDAASQGTVFSDGAAVVLLKPLSAALRDANPIYAVVRGVAVNNDGGDKASFTAPSVDGQAAVVGDALRRAGVPADTISYLEAHGTATPLGDPVEVEALRRAYAPLTDRRGFCGIGSVKSNVGHTVMAAGAAGVIKTALALHHQWLPATIHFDRPNPKIDFSRTPFKVVDKATAWPRTDTPRRAGVSSFGVGGTNAHLILEEAPAIGSAVDSRTAGDAASPLGAQPRWLRLSARTGPALRIAATQLAEHLRAHPRLDLADVAYTLDVGRSRFAHRLAVVADDLDSAATALSDPTAAQRRARAVIGKQDEASRPAIWLFPGQGAQYLGMGRARGERDPVFRQAFDDALQATGISDLRERIWGQDIDALNETAVTQPAIFCIEYALAQSWLGRGWRAAAVIGHSIGEFAAAVVAQVMTLDDAARSVASRGALMQAQPRGSMLAVMMSVDELMPLLPAELSLAAINAPQACVVAGPTPAVQAFDAQLQQRGSATRLLRTSHAFHSAMMDAVVAPFAEQMATVTLAAPRLPFYSTLRGERVDAAQLTDIRYWTAHLRDPVRFAPALHAALAQWPDALLVEMGPRAHLSALARQRSAVGAVAPLTVAALGESPAEEGAADLLARALLWTLGDERDSEAGAGESGAPRVTAQGSRRRVLLPTYPFERQRHWLDTGGASNTASTSNAATVATPDAPAVIASGAVTAVAAALSALTSGGPPAEHFPGTIVMNLPAAPARRDRLLTDLRTVFEDTSGLDLAQADSAASFVELGLDSLMLTQVALQVKKRFTVPVTFRKLMEELRSFDQLVAYLDAQMPADVAAAAPAAPAAIAVPMAASTPGVARAMPAAMTTPMPLPALAATGDSTLVQQVIAAQMQLMSQQLALLAAAGTAAGTAAGMAPAMPSVAQALAAPAAAPAAVPVPAAPVCEASVAAASTPAAEVAEVTEAVEGKAVYDVKKAFGAIARIRKQDSALTDLQRVRLDALIRRYVERTRKSKAYTEQHRPHLADPRVVNGFSPKLKEIVYQIVIERSKGAHLWDLDGNQYVDVLNGFGMSLFGWQPQFVLDAVRRQLDLGYEIGPQHPLAGEVAQLMCELTGFDRAALCNTGSEAVMAAVRMARTVTGRDTVVLFSGSYHGTFDEVVVRQGRQAKGLPAAPGIMPGMFGDVRVLDYGTDESLAWIRDHADELAAVLVEPVQSRRTDFQPKDFLRALRELTTSSGSCLIFDEVITGFRAHLGGVQQLFGIQADLATYGKVIGGGYPVGVVAGRRAFMDALDGGAWQYGDESAPTVGVTYFAGTFVRHPLALAACKASLQHLKDSGHALQTQLNLHTSGLANELNAHCREVGAPLQIRHFASLWRIVMLEEHPMQDLLFAMMRTRGVHILDNFPCFLTTAHTPADIALIKQAFKESVAELQAADFLPRRADAPVVFDAAHPPVPNARLGRGKDGRPAWFVPDPDQAGKYKRLNA